MRSSCRQISSAPLRGGSRVSSSTTMGRETANARGSRHCAAVALKSVLWMISRMAPRPRTPAEFWAMLLPPNDRGCRLWPLSKSPDCYGKSYWDGRPYSAHQVAFLLTHGWVPSGRRIVIRHICDVPACCEPSHLITGTQQQNAQDRIDRGRSPKPVSWRSPLAKLTPSQVREIRARHASGESYPSLGRAFGMHPQNIGRICRRQGYRDVT